MVFRYKKEHFVSKTHLKNYCADTLLVVSRPIGTAMATSGEFKFLTLGLLLVVVGLTSVATGKCEDSALEETDSLPAFPETAVEQLFDGYVYLLEEANPDNGPNRYFKIGFSVDPNERRDQLQTGNPRELSLVYSRLVRNHVACEGRVKVALVNYKCPHGGGTEWYIAHGNDRVRTLKAVFTRTVNQYCL